VVIGCWFLGVAQRLSSYGGDADGNELAFRIAATNREGKKTAAPVTNWA
jgi:hypothetical protein